MPGILIYGPDKDYRRILTDEATIRKRYVADSNRPTPEQLIEKLLSGERALPGDFDSYGGSPSYDIVGRKEDLPACIADFFREIEAYRDQHKADEVHIQKFHFESIPHGAITLSVTLQLLLARDKK